MAAGDEKAPVEHADWFGQPAHADAFPAVWEVGPTQPSLASVGASPGDDILEMERRINGVRNKSVSSVLSWTTTKNKR